MAKKGMSVFSEDEDDSEDEAFKPKRRPSAKPKVRTDTGIDATKKKKNTKPSKRKRDSAAASSSKQCEPPGLRESEEPVKKKDEERNIVKDMNALILANTAIASTVDNMIELPVTAGKSDAGSFCPLCQVPLRILKIAADMHTASCNVSGNLPDCPEGIECLNSNIFHYRDYSHHKLAIFRDSEEYIAPDIVFTPQKAKRRTPSKVSVTKKRPSKSPVDVSASKIPKTEEPCCSKNLPPESPPGSPDMFSEDSITVRQETVKRLSFSDDRCKVERGFESSSNNTQNQEDQNDIPEQDSRLCFENQPSFEGADNLEGQRNIQEQDSGSFPKNQLVKEELEIVSNCDTAIAIKDEPLSQGTVGENVHPSSNNAKVLIYYNRTADGIEQRLHKRKIECTESCVLPTAQSSQYYDSLQATCSITIGSRGVSKEEAMARCPLSVTLMVNSSGWEAVDIKGRESSNIHNIDVSLCHCAHSMCLECHITDTVLTDEKFIPEQVEEHDKFFITMADMGLKNQETYVQPLNHDDPERKDFFLRNCHKITVSSNVKQEGMFESMPIPLVETAYNEEEGTSFHAPNVSESRAANSNESLNRNEDVNGREHSIKTYKCEAMSTSSVSPLKKSAFSVLKKMSVAGIHKKERSASPSNFLWSKVKDGGSRPNSPLIVSKMTDSSWTLVPGKAKPSLPERRGQANGSRKIPAYKRIPDSPIVVDAFNYGVIPGVKAYFLSHFHADHYIGLRKGFTMPIFCSQVTANLVHLKLRIEKEYIHVLKFGEPRTVCGVEIDIFDANHCPGAVMFLFRLMDGRTFLHVGDFRAHPSMEDFPQLKHVDKLFLDTTYCDPAYNFPSQEDVVGKVISTVQLHMSQNTSTLFVCGTYTIGKEKVFMGIAEKFNWKIWTSTEKKRVLQCLEDKDISKRLTNDPFAAQVHVLAMRDIALEELFQHLNKLSPKYSHIVGFKPTGWTTSTSLKGKPSDFQKSTRGKVTIYGVPYSEHSSFSELRQFVRFIKPKDIQVTVNVSKSAQYKKTFNQWLSNSRDDSQSKMIRFLTTSSR